MRARVLLVISLLANVVLLLGWLAQSQRGASDRTASPASNTPALVIRTNVELRRQFFSWEEIESSDYATYIANLRAIFCPEQTIRDLIIADVNSLYARRRATEVITPQQQWWRAEPDSNVVAAAVMKIRELELERRALLTSLLGDDWETGDQINLPRPSREGVPLDGPVLGSLPQQTKLAVQDIVAKASDRTQNYVISMRSRGLEPDLAEVARLRQETRRDLAGVLSPPELEEYLLRYSDNARSLREELAELRYFNATADEFRSMFRATDDLEMKMQLLANATDAQSIRQYLDLKVEREMILRNTLGEDRYNQYHLLQDEDFREAYAAAHRAGTPDSALALYQIKIAAEQELARLNAATNMTAEQRAVELKRAELEQLKANALALGQSLPTEPDQPPPLPKYEPLQKVHVLNGGESIDFLARLYGMSPAALRAANPDLNFDRLRPGDSLNVPYPVVLPNPQGAQ